MCKLGGGANRCDAHWGPTQKAADLARRRAKYAAKKGGEVRFYRKKDNDEATTAVKELLTEAEAVIPEKPKVVAVNLNNKVLLDADGNYDSSLLQETGEVHTDEDLQLQRHELTGSLTESKYYANQTVTGDVNWENLDSSSYSEFGFQHPWEIRTNPGLRDDIQENMEKEVELMTPEEENAATMFTNLAYKWINRSLYNRDPDEHHHLPSNPDRDITEVTETFVQSDQKTIASYEKIVSTLDSALEKSSGQQRILYRGIKRGDITLPGETLDEALDRLSLGQEMVFDGYQSSSYSPSTAASFSHIGDTDHGGVMMEILSSSGTNITRVSDHPGEKEVLLPRNARYMIVGIHKNFTYRAADSSKLKKPYKVEHKGSYMIQVVEVTEDGSVAHPGNRPAAAPALTDLQKTEIGIS